ncbi:MAG: NAD(P)-dependent oxidoreductase [Nibricoccus sp.]
MKILVTGSSGFIGRWLCKQLFEAGFEVIGLDRVEPQNPSLMHRFVKSDILDGCELKRAFNQIMPDAIIHLAARIDLDERESIAGYATNVDGVKNLIEAIQECRTVRRAIFTSSQLVCRVGHVPMSETEYCPNTLYGRSKVMTEQLVRDRNGGNVEWCLVRPTTVWGPYMSSHYQHMLHLIRKGWYFHCGNGQLLKSYVYVENIAHQYLGLLTADRAAIYGQTFYLADYEPLSLREYTIALGREMNAPQIPTLPISLARVLARAGDLINWTGIARFPFNTFRLNNILTEYIFDVTRTASVCGPALVSQQEGIRRTAKWFMESPDCNP